MGGKYTCRRMTIGGICVGLVLTIALLIAPTRKSDQLFTQTPDAPRMNLTSSTGS